MSTTPQYSSGQPPTAPNRWLWAAIAALGATTLAMGALMLQMRSGTTPIAGPTTSAGVSLPALAAPASAPASTTQMGVAADSYPSKVPVAPVKHTQSATKPVANKSMAHPAVTSQPSAPIPPAALPPPLPPKVVCAHCGTVTAVRPVEHDGAGSGAGAVAGALLGGLLGNQVGGGTGKTIATVVGAVGGGYAGNTVEKRMKKETAYQIDVLMDDGTTRRFEHSSPLSVGAQVTVNGSVLTP